MYTSIMDYQVIKFYLINIIYGFRQGHLCEIQLINNVVEDVEQALDYRIENNSDQFS